MNFLKIDSPFMEGMRKLSDVIICNLLFVLCCFPVFTIGASLAALYEAMLILIAGVDDGFLFVDFFKAFKKHFKRATLTWLICLLVAGILYLYYHVISSLGGPMQKVYTVTFYTILFLLLFIYQYLYPMLVYHSGKIRENIKNALALSTACFQFTLLSILLLVASAVLSWMIFYQGGYAVVFIWLICGFGLICYMNSMLFRIAIKRVGMETDNIAIAEPFDEGPISDDQLFDYSPHVNSLDDLKPGESQQGIGQSAEGRQGISQSAEGQPGNSR